MEKKNKIWFTSDTHFCHNREFLYKPRGFNSIEEHDKAIIDRWNSIVKPEDIVYHLGDVMLMDNEKGMYYLKQLNGHIHIIAGNHCTNTRLELYKEVPNVEDVQYAHQFKYGKMIFYLSHYPTYMGNYDEQMSRTWCLSGHTHFKEKFTDTMPKNYNVAMDAHNCYPVEISEIVEDIRKKWNEIHKEQQNNQ